MFIAPMRLHQMTAKNEVDIHGQKITNVYGAIDLAYLAYCIYKKKKEIKVLHDF